jgi:hypothetical protein
MRLVGLSPQRHGVFGERREVDYGISLSSRSKQTPIRSLQEPRKMVLQGAGKRMRAMAGSASWSKGNQARARLPAPRLPSAP